MPALRSVLFALVLGLAGCGSASTLTEVKPVTSGLGTYQTIAVHVTPAPNDEGGKWSAYFAKELSTRLKDKGVFANVVTDPNGTGDVVLDLKFTKLDIPHGAATTFAAGSVNANVDLDGTLTKGGSTDSLGTFVVTGNSSHKGRTTVGGFGVSGPDSYVEAAIEQAASRVTTYFAEKKK